MELTIFNDEYFMRQAIREAKKAVEEDEVPIGCVVVSNNHIIARTHNLTETLNDITAHAEMQAITAASNNLGSKYLDKCTIFITLEPCLMCAGALRWAQIGRIVYGAADKKYGFGRYIETIAHPKTKVSGGVMQEECSRMLTDFFRMKRMK